MSVQILVVIKSVIFYYVLFLLILLEELGKVFKIVPDCLIHLQLGNWCENTKKMLSGLESTCWFWYMCVVIVCLHFLM
jgi:hypothetical protein